MHPTRAWQQIVEIINAKTGAGFHRGRRLWYGRVRPGPATGGASMLGYHEALVDVVLG